MPARATSLCLDGPGPACPRAPWGGRAADALPLRTGRRAVYPALLQGSLGEAEPGAMRAQESPDRQTMRGEPGPDAGQGMDGVLLAHRAQLIRFLEAHGAGDAAEDLFQELWMRVTQRPTGPIGNPLGYLYRAANNLMVDRYRAERQARARDQAWTEARGLSETAPEPTAEEQMITREDLRRLDQALDALGERASRCFRLYRLEGIPQRQIAAELGVSLSTVESDLRRAYAALLAARRQSDDA